MIEVKIYRAGAAINGFAVSGHSDFAVRGTDIVCAAVSALSQTAVLALAEVAGVSSHWRKVDGLLDCQVPAGISGEQFAHCQIIFQTILTGIKNIARQYPDFIRMTTEEV